MCRLIYVPDQDIERQINGADLKAQITRSSSAVLMAMLVNLGTGIRAGAKLYNVRKGMKYLLTAFGLWIVARMALFIACGVHGGA